MRGEAHLESHFSSIGIKSEAGWIPIELSRTKLKYGRTKI